MGIRQWWHRKQRERLEQDEQAAHFDHSIEIDREAAEKARLEAKRELEEVRRLRPESQRVQQQFERVKEENHFSDWLFSLPPKRRRA